MADKKISSLTELTSPSSSDLLHVIDTSGTFTNKKMTVGNMVQNVPTWLAFKDAVQTVNTNGAAIDASTSITHINSTSAVLGLTIANGTTGQIKFVTMTVAGNNAVLSGANIEVPTSITFDAVGESVTLLYTNSKWVIVGVYGATVA